MVAQRRTARPNAPIDHHWDTEATEIIPLNEFGATADSTIDRDPFATDVDVLAAPELDDVNDLADEWPRVLLPPVSYTSPAPCIPPKPFGGARRDGAEVLPRQRAPSAGAHRLRPTTHRRKPQPTKPGSTDVVGFGVGRESEMPCRGERMGFL